MSKTRCHKIEGGAWGCVVVISTFLIQFIVFGTSQSIGIYNVEFLQYFDASAAAVALVGAINLGVILGTGPLASLLMKRWSCRQIALVGAVLANSGIIAMPFASDLQFMCVFYGVITGLGSSLLFTPSHVLSGLYFYKQRSFATGLATAGSGFGASVFPIIVHHMIEYYGWKGSFFIVAGVNLHLFVFAALLRPVPQSLFKYLKALEIGYKQRNSSDIKHETEKISRTEIKHGNIEIRSEKTDAVAIEISYNPVERYLKFGGYLNEAYRSEHDTECSSSEIKTLSLSLASAGGALGDGGGSLVFNDTNVQHINKSMKDKFKHHCEAVFTFDFVFFCFSNVFWNAGAAILLLFLPEYMIRIGISKEDSSIAFLAVGIGSCIGCVIGGVLGNVKRLNRIVLYVCANFGIGIGTALMVWPILYPFAGMFTLSLLVGLTFGITLGLLVVITSDLLGTERMSDGYGYLMFWNGVGMFGGPALAGYLIDVTGRMEPGIIFAAVLSMMGGIVMYVVPLKQRILGHVNKHGN